MTGFRLRAIPFVLALLTPAAWAQPAAPPDKDAPVLTDEDMPPVADDEDQPAASGKDKPPVVNDEDLPPQAG